MEEEEEEEAADKNEDTDEKNNRATEMIVDAETLCQDPERPEAAQLNGKNINEWRKWMKTSFINSLKCMKYK